MYDRISDRIGLVIYAGESFTKTPITSDRAIVKNALGEIQFEGLIEMELLLEWDWLLR